VSVIDVPTLTLKSTIPVGEGPSDIAITPDGRLAFVASDGTVSVIDVRTLTVTSTIPVGGSPSGIAFTSEGNMALVVNGGNNTVTVI
jgi:YVTN family beta-propeller protein